MLSVGYSVRHSQWLHLEHGAHQPVFMDNGNKPYIQYAMVNLDNSIGLESEMSPTLRDKYNKATLISESKLKKRKHGLSDSGFRGY